MVILAATIVVVLIGSALCSGAEAALLSVSKVRVRQLAQNGGRRARALLAVTEHIARPIAAIVVANNIFNIVGSMMVGTIAATVFGQVWVGAVSAVLTFLIIVFGEVMPKTVAERYSEKVALWVAMPVRAVTWVLTPVVALLGLLLRPLTRGERPPTTDEHEIRLLVNIGRSEGIIEDDEADMIQRVFQLNDRSAQDLMTPRAAVTWLEASKPIAEVSDEILASEHSRIVVLDTDRDEVTGVALKHELLAALLDDADARVADHTREVDAVPWLVPADDLLQRFRAARTHLMLVVDEHGSTIGVVTLEDVLEVLTGEIIDETDRRPDLRRYALARHAVARRRRQGVQWR